MLKEILLPELSDNVSQADVLKVLVSPGDRVTAEQALLELETDKAVFEFPSPEAGTIREIRVGAGEVVRVGQVLFLIEAEDVTEVPGATSGSRVPSAVPARPAPPPPPPGRPTTPVSEPVPAAGEGGRPAPAAPHVRKLARELGVDLVAVRGTGMRGRVTEEDVRRASLGPPPHSPAEIAPSPPPRGEVLAVGVPPLTPMADRGADRREALSKVRRITAEVMARSWATVPQVTHDDRADITDLEAFRQRRAAQVERSGGRLTVTAILAKVCAEALLRFPILNASLDPEVGEIVYHGEVALGVAVDTDRGLLVPVVREADRKSVGQLAVEIAVLAERARTRKILPSEMEGATFTISNLGGIGGTSFSPIVVPPQAAILGVSRAAREPVWGGAGFEPRLMLPLSLTYDHRLVDGADGARFLRWICEALEEPWSAWL